MCYEESENPRPSVKLGIVNGNVGNFDNQASVSNFWLTENFCKRWFLGRRKWVTRYTLDDPFHPITSLWGEERTEDDDETPK